MDSPHTESDSSPPEGSHDPDQGCGEPDDHALVAAAVSGERSAYEVLVRRHGPALHRFARRMVRSDDDAADVVQDTFVSAWRQLDSFRGDARWRTWLFSICSRKIIDSHRVRRSQPLDDALLSTRPDTGAVDPFTFASNSVFVEALEAALAELPPRQRASWMLKEMHGHTFPEIGVELGLSADAARGQHHRAKATLGERMARWR